jgi:hypothetical protein
MLVEMKRFEDYGGQAAEIPPEAAIQRAHHYRRAADYISDPVMSSLLLKLADDFETHARG